MSVHLTGVCLMGMYLTGVHLMDVCLMGIRLRVIYFMGSVSCTPTRWLASA